MSFPKQEHILLFLNHPGLFISNCSFSRCWRNLGCSVNNSFKESDRRPPRAPGSKGSIRQALLTAVSAREDFLLLLCMCNSSIRNSKKRFMFIYGNPSCSVMGWASKESHGPLWRGEAGAEKQQFKCRKVEREWTFLEFLVGATQLCWASGWRRDICASVGQNASQVRSPARPAGGCKVEAGIARGRLPGGRRVDNAT